MNLNANIRYQTSVQAGDFTIYKDLTIYNTGNVTAMLEFRMQAKCDIDYHNYPAVSNITFYTNVC